MKLYDALWLLCCYEAIHYINVVDQSDLSFIAQQLFAERLGLA